MEIKSSRLAAIKKLIRDLRDFEIDLSIMNNEVIECMDNLNCLYAMYGRLYSEIYDKNHNSTLRQVCSDEDINALFEATASKIKETLNDITISNQELYQLNNLRNSYVKSIDSLNR